MTSARSRIFAFIVLAFSVQNVQPFFLRLFEFKKNLILPNTTDMTFPGFTLSSNCFTTHTITPTTTRSTKLSDMWLIMTSLTPTATTPTPTLPTTSTTPTASTGRTTSAPGCLLMARMTRSWCPWTCARASAALRRSSASSAGGRPSLSGGGRVTRWAPPHCLMSRPICQDPCSLVTPESRDTCHSLALQYLQSVQDTHWVSPDTEQMLTGLSNPACD